METKVEKIYNPADLGLCGCEKCNESGSRVLLFVKVEHEGRPYEYVTAEGYAHVKEMATNEELQSGIASENTVAGGKTNRDWRYYKGRAKSRSAQTK